MKGFWKFGFNIFQNHMKRQKCTHLWQRLDFRKMPTPEESASHHISRMQNLRFLARECLDLNKLGVYRLRKIRDCQKLCRGHRYYFWQLALQMQVFRYSSEQSSQGNPSDVALRGIFGKLRFKCN